MTNRRRRAALEQQRAQQIRRRRSLYTAGGIALVVLVIGGALAAIGLATPSSPPINAAAAQAGAAACSPIQVFPTLSQDHIAPNQSHPPYSSNPPTSGWHWATPQDWGVYTTPQAQEQLLHDLEHGGIVIQYNNLSSAEVQQLTDLVNRDNHHMILAPYPGLPSDVRVALTAWDHLQTCTGVNVPAVQAFINGLRDKGPELVP